MASLAEAKSHNVPPEVFLRHWREIRDAKQAHADTGMALARCKKAAKSAGIDMDALKRVEKLHDLDEDEARMQIEHEGIYVRWLKLPIGTQAEMFGKGKVDQPSDAAREEHEEWEAGEAGLTAGKNGRAKDENPHTPGERLHVAWHRNWSKGNKQWLKEQKGIASEMGENAGLEEARSNKRRRNGAEEQAAIN